MTMDPDDHPKNASETLARLVAERKAAQGQRNAAGVPGRKQSERAAGALSASKSRPALRK